MIGDFGYFLVAFAGHGHDDAFARFHFLQIGKRLLVERAALVDLGVARRQHHHRQVLVNQRVRPVLHLARRIAFGVNIGNLLQLERAFERNRKVNAPPQI